MNRESSTYHPPSRAILERYRQAVDSLPKAGEGAGCHPGLLRVANLGVIAGIPPTEIFSDLRIAVDGSRRYVSDKEIEAAIKKAAMDHRTNFRPSRLYKPKHKTSRDCLHRIIEKGQDFDINKFQLLSQYPIDPESGYKDTIATLKTLYNPNEYLFMGSRTEPGILGLSIRKVGEWIKFTQKTKSPPEHIIPNPLTGQSGRTKDGKISFRADDCIKSFRFAIAEFDNISKDDQLRFWGGSPFPVAALIDSGNKSIHAWIRVDCINRAEWESAVERRLFDSILGPMGVDSSCKNESRLSRTPGHFRSERKCFQRLLFLSKMGGAFSESRSN